MTHPLHAFNDLYDPTSLHSTHAADAVAAALCPDDLITIRLALRLAATSDAIGNAVAFVDLYRRLGGCADFGDP